MKKSRRATKARRGAAILEMAMIGSFLCALLLTAFDIGRIQVIAHAVETAAYEAARAGVSPGASEEDVTSVASELLDLVDAHNYTVGVNPSPLNAQANQVTVEVEMPMRGNLLFLPYDRVIRRQTTITRQPR